MKRSITALFALLISSALYALPIGNPLDASFLCNGVFWEGDCCTDPCEPCLSLCDAWSVRVGFYADYVYDRHLQIDSKEYSATIHRTKLITNAGYLALNMWDRLDIFGTLGATYIRLAAPKFTFPSAGTNEMLFLETETNFSWSVGGRATLWEWGCLGIGAEVQYFYTRPNINFIRNENNRPFYSIEHEPFIYQEWQLGFGAAYRINIAACSATALVPYAGIKWSRVLVDLDNFMFIEAAAAPISATFLDLKNDRNFGYAIGLTLVGCNKISLTVEGRFADERALHFNGQVRF